MSLKSQCSLLSPHSLLIVSPDIEPKLKINSVAISSRSAQCPSERTAHLSFRESHIHRCWNLIRPPFPRQAHSPQLSGHSRAHLHSDLELVVPFRQSIYIRIIFSLLDPRGTHRQRADAGLCSVLLIKERKWGPALCNSVKRGLSWEGQSGVSKALTTAKVQRDVSFSVY